jgi:hypothetical protein
MSNAELLIEKIKGLPDDCAAENVLDAEWECPLCAKYRDPVTGEPRFNARTIAAFEEGDAMLRGEIPAKWYASFEEMWEDLEK